MRQLFRRSALFACIVFGTAAFGAARTEQTKHYSVDSGGVALGGYDPVSYFGTPKPSKGDPNITAEVDGVVYRFASDANRDAFLSLVGGDTKASGER